MNYIDSVYIIVEESRTTNVMMFILIIQIILPIDFYITGLNVFPFSHVCCYIHVINRIITPILWKPEPTCRYSNNPN